MVGGCRGWVSCVMATAERVKVCIWLSNFQLRPATVVIMDKITASSGVHCQTTLDMHEDLCVPVCIPQSDDIKARGHKLGQATLL